MHFWQKVPGVSGLINIVSYTYTVAGVLCRITADRGSFQPKQSAITVN